MNGETRVEHQFCLRTRLPMERRDISQYCAGFPGGFMGWVSPLLPHRCPWCQSSRTGFQGPRGRPLPGPGLSKKRTKGFSRPEGQPRGEVQHGLPPAALDTWAGVLSLEHVHLRPSTTASVYTLCSGQVHSVRVGRPISIILSHLFV